MLERLTSLKSSGRRSRIDVLDSIRDEEYDLLENYKYEMSNAAGKDRGEYDALDYSRYTGPYHHPHREHHHDHHHSHHHNYQPYNTSRKSTAPYLLPLFHHYYDHNLPSSSTSSNGGFDNVANKSSGSLVRKLKRITYPGGTGMSESNAVVSHTSNGNEGFGAMIEELEGSPHSHSAATKSHLRKGGLGSSMSDDEGGGGGEEYERSKEDGLGFGAVRKRSISEQAPVSTAATGTSSLFFAASSASPRGDSLLDDGWMRENDYLDRGGGGSGGGSGYMVDGFPSTYVSGLGTRKSSNNADIEKSQSNATVVAKLKKKKLKKKKRSLLKMKVAETTNASMDESMSDSSSSSSADESNSEDDTLNDNENDANLAPTSASSLSSSSSILSTSPFFSSPFSILNPALNSLPPPSSLSNKRSTSTPLPHRTFHPYLPSDFPHPPSSSSSSSSLSAAGTSTTKHNITSTTPRRYGLHPPLPSNLTKSRSCSDSTTPIGGQRWGLRGFSGKSSGGHHHQHLHRHNEYNRHWDRGFGLEMGGSNDGLMSGGEDKHHSRSPSSSKSKPGVEEEDFEYVSPFVAGFGNGAGRDARSNLGNSANDGRSGGGGEKDGSLYEDGIMWVLGSPIRRYTAAKSRRGGVPPPPLPKPSTLMMMTGHDRQGKGSAVPLSLRGQGRDESDESDVEEKGEGATSNSMFMLDDDAEKDLKAGPAARASILREATEKWKEHRNPHHPRHQTSFKPASSTTTPSPTSGGINRGGVQQVSETAVMLFHDAVLTHDLSFVEAYLLSGGDPNAADSKGRTALHFACTTSSPSPSSSLSSSTSTSATKDMLNLLLSYGANPDLKDSNGNTPLHLAVCSNKMDMVLGLLKGGADFGVLDKWHRSPMDLVQSRLKHLGDRADVGVGARSVLVGELLEVSCVEPFFFFFFFFVTTVLTNSLFFFFFPFILSLID
jgi:hypothetical protein